MLLEIEVSKHVPAVKFSLAWQKQTPEDSRHQHAPLIYGWEGGRDL